MDDITHSPHTNRPSNWIASFNGQRALRFDIGLVRLMCTNGMLITDTLVSFRFLHSKAALAQTPQFKVDHPKLKSWLDGFDANIATLRGHQVSPAVILELVLGVLRLHPPSSPDAPAYLVREWEDSAPPAGPDHALRERGRRERLRGFQRVDGLRDSVERPRFVLPRGTHAAKASRDLAPRLLRTGPTAGFQDGRVPHVITPKDDTSRI
ncbi:MAG: DUF932 domain-containing protein [Proteobacteria bacterium]|nr:DUF932 domain-containing protein [Pseudomonadota bacterium]